MNNNPKEKPDHANDAEVIKQNQDFPNIPAANENQNPPDIKKEDIEESSENNETGKTDNTEQSEE